jgi:hypothetical protein
VHKLSHELGHKLGRSGGCEIVVSGQVPAGQVERTSGHAHIACMTA